MGRAASINLDDVRNARASLIAANKPHGIIAIRKQIGRGSPQLISKLLLELNEQVDGSEKLPSEISKQSKQGEAGLNHAWRSVAQSIENLIVANNPPTLTANNVVNDARITDAVATSNTKEAEQYPTDRLAKLEHLVKQQQTQLSKLGEQLMQQQDLFDSWRHEQHAERQLLKTQLDQLMQVVVKKPTRKLRKKGEQLDLYRDGNN